MLIPTPWEADSVSGASGLLRWTNPMPDRDVFSLRLVAAVRPLVAIALIASCVACAREQPAIASKQESDAQLQCEPRATGATGLPEEWNSFAPFIESCRLSSSSGDVALEIITVSAKRFYDTQPSGVVTVSFPKPLLRSADQQELGQLPYSYPDDPPVSIELTFSEWLGGRPQQIDILVRDPTVSGDHNLTPLRWDSLAARYRGGAER
jgi:hypothetical protein